MARFGDWKKLQDILRQHDQRLLKNCTQALLQAGLRLEAMIKDRIIQGKGMAPLHEFTVEQKGSSKPLIDEADLLGSVALRFVRQDAVFVGVKRKAKSGADLARLHEREQGTKIKVTPKMRKYLHAQGLHLKKETQELFIPGRPFVKPTYEDFKDKKVATKLFAKAVKKTLQGD